MPEGDADRDRRAGPLVSVLVVNYNGERFLADCLDALSRVTYGRVEVVVVDNASTDGSRDVLAGYGWVRVVWSGENLGYAGGNNLGWEHCSGELVVLLNSDTVPEPGFLEPVVAFFASDARVGVVQSKMTLPRHGGVLDACGSFLTPLGFLYHYGYWKPDDPRYGSPFRVFSGKGAALTVRRDVVELCGGYLFDASFFCYYEETDLCHRVWLSGHEVWFLPSSRVAHLHGATAEAELTSGQVMGRYLRNQTFGLLTNLSAWGRLRVLPGYFALLLAGCLAAWLAGRGGLAAAHGRAMWVGLKDLKKVRAHRRLVADLRRIRDSELFARVMVWPGFGYFWKTFRGRLAAHEDRDLPGAVRDGVPSSGTTANRDGADGMA